MHTPPATAAPPAARPSPACPKPLVPGRQHRASGAVPAPRKFGGGVRGFPPGPSPYPTPTKHLGPGFKAASHLDFIFTASVPSFLLPLWKGVPGPQAWHLPFHRGGRWVFGDSVVLLRLPLPPPGQPPPTTMHRLCFKVFASYLSCVYWSHRKKVISAYNLIHIFKRFSLERGRGAPEPSLPRCVNNRVHPARRTHRMHAQTQHFPKPPPRPRRGTRLPGLTLQTAQHKATRTCQRCRKATLWRDPYAHTHTRRGKALPTPGNHTL